MARWQVQLRGDPFDLQELPPLFTSPDLRIVEESEGEDRFFYLEAATFEAITEYKEVAEAAYELLPTIIGSAKLKVGSLGEIGVGAIHELEDDGQRHATIIYEVGTARVRLRGSVVSLVMNGIEVPTPSPGSTDPDQWARLATRNQDAAEALAIWGTKPHNWPNLYGILEIIEHSDASPRDWASRGQLERFSRTANHHIAGGEDARHRRSRVDPPANPMTPAEGEAFIRDLLANWLGSLG